MNPVYLLEKITIIGVEYFIPDACNKFEVKYNTYCCRRLRGLNIEESFFGKKRKIIDISNQKFNMLTAKSFDVINNKWICECECGKNRDVSYWKLTSGRTKSCGCVKKRCGKETPYFMGYEEISGAYFSGIKRNAEIRNIEFKISIEYLWKLYLNQNKKCNLSGEDIVFNVRQKSKRLQTVSLDRIDSSIGYIEGNVQWVHKNVNFMKYQLGQQEFIDLCEKIYKYNKGKNENITY